MTKILNDNSFTVSGWMINSLQLKGTPLLIFAIIYGFSQDGESSFFGSRSYLAEFTGVNSVKTVDNALNYLQNRNLIIKIPHTVGGVINNEYKVNLEEIKKCKICTDLKKLHRGCKNYTGGVKITQGGVKITHNNKTNTNILTTNTNFSTITNCSGNINNSESISFSGLSGDNATQDTQNPVSSSNKSSSNYVKKQMDIQLFNKKEEVKKQDLKKAEPITLIKSVKKQKTDRKNQSIITNYKRKIDSYNFSSEISKALYQWIDSLFESNKCINSVQFELAIAKIIEYQKDVHSEHDIVTAIKDAALSAYTNFNWTMPKKSFTAANNKTYNYHNPDRHDLEELPGETRSDAVKRELERRKAAGIQEY